MALEWVRKGSDLLFQDTVLAGKGQFLIGSFSSATAGVGLKLSSNRTTVFRVCTDDGGAAIGAGSYRASESRLLLTGTCGATNTSMSGHESHVKVASDYSGASGLIGGAWNYIEIASGGNVNYASATHGMIDCPTGATIGGVLSCFMAASNDLTGTHTGPATVLHVTNPVAGTFDFFAVFGSAPGGIAAKSTALSGLSSNYRLIVKCPDGTTGYVPVIGTWS